ncbi:MAG: ankyrin repeat domain-containing protein [Candidatus Korobacteraceae bacterium]|jgi:ankyrin repeat protein
MKKVLKAIFLSAVVLSLSLLAAGQATPGSLDDQLIQAEGNGDSAAVQQLLQKGAHIEARDPHGNTALAWAAKYGRTEVVKLLLDRGANIEAKDGDGWTPLMVAAVHGNTNVVKLLLDKGANIAAKYNGETALFMAAGSGYVEIVNLLLEKGADFEPGDRDVLLTGAASRGQLKIVKLLLDRGANIEAQATARPYDGDTALIRASYEGHSEMVKLLLDRGANIEARNKAGDTALIVAANIGKPEVVKVLLENGAQIEARDTDGYTALYLTTLKQKVDEEVVKRFGASPVYQEPLSQHTEVVRLLKQALSQKPLASLAESVNDLQKKPYDDATREKAIKLAVGLTALPPIPEDARQLFLQASALIKQTSTAQELQKPIELLGKALIIAPWWGNAYYNLSRAQELSGDYDEAVKQLNYYIELKPSDAEASEARSHISIIQAEKEATAQRKHQNESMLAVKYVSGGVTRLRYDDKPAWWHPGSGYGIEDLYTYDVREEEPFYANTFRMPNGKLLVITLEAQSNNGMYAGDKVHVGDITNNSCTQGSEFAFGERSYTEPCGFHYDVSVSNQPNATVTVTYPATGASVTLPVALLYRGRVLKATGPFGNCNGTVYQGGTQAKVLHFDCAVFDAARDPNVNAMGLTPTSVTMYQPNKK